MTISNKATLKTYFITGATPSQSNFTDFIDTILSLGETSVQVVSGPVAFNNTVSANNGLSVNGTFAVSGNALGTAAFLNTGVSANNIPVLDSSNRLPAVNGSLLTNIQGTLTLLSTQTAAGATTVDFTSGIDSTYKHYIIEISNLTTSGVVDLFALFYQGGSFVTTANYSYSLLEAHGGASTAITGETQTSLRLTSVGGVDSTIPASLILHMFQPNLTTKTTIFGMGALSYATASRSYLQFFSGFYNVAAATTGIRFQVASGTISGTFKLYGVS